MDISEQKKIIRKQILTKRNLLSKDEVLSTSKIICDKIISLDVYNKCNDICIYSPINNEVNVFLLIEHMLKHNKNIYLPKTFDNSISFFEYDGESDLVLGKYNILEPIPNNKLIPNSNTLIIMPGAVFSYNCERIGYGGGYYDRFLHDYPMCNTLAVAYDFQVLPQIPCENHDIKPQQIITEQKVINFLENIR